MPILLQMFSGATRNKFRGAYIVSIFTIYTRDDILAAKNKVKKQNASLKILTNYLVSIVYFTTQLYVGFFN